MEEAQTFGLQGMMTAAVAARSHPRRHSTNVNVAQHGLRRAVNHIANLSHPL